MKWNKKGFICSHKTLNLKWYKKNTMVPVPYLVNNKILRIFITMCDKDNIGRIGYIDVNPNNPKQILDYSKTPCLDIGLDGMFDDNGVLPSCLIEKDERLYMFYSAYQKQSKVPYTIFSGIAVSEDQGKNFIRAKKTPILDRIEDELFIRSAIYCLKDNDKYKIWYSSGSNWINNGLKIAPKYNLRYLESNDILNLNNKSRPAIELENDEYGLTTPHVFKENNIYKMTYAIRSISKGYRMGYSESKDGIKWNRIDKNMDIDVSKKGFDSEMICFGNIFKFKDITYLFYCGNHYGIGGMGYAELI